MRLRSTKIVVTAGPATADAAVAADLVAAGANVIRINFSHGTYDDHVAQIAAFRRASADQGGPVAIMQDLQGPKVRLGKVTGGGVSLPRGSRVTLHPDNGEMGTAERLPVSLQDLAAQVAVGDRILIDDGAIRLRVQSLRDDGVLAVVEEGGLVSDRKGINLPDTFLDVPSLTNKDLADLSLGVEQQVDFVALSFVRAAADIRLLRHHLKQLGSEARIVAKIEKREAILAIDSIVEEADAVMVARGDLGVEMAPEVVPLHQKAIVQKCIAAGKEVIIATQMLESMTRAASPTRAEASDVANAVYDGASAVMLSGETAVGDHPVLVLETMDRIVCTTEERLTESQSPQSRVSWPGVLCDMPVGPAVAEAISRAAYYLASELSAAAIITPTQTGATARQVARFRPFVPIVAATISEAVQRQLCLPFGVHPLLVREAEDTDGTIGLAVEAACGAGIVSEGDSVVVTCGAKISTPGSTNLIKVERVPSAGRCGPA